MNPHSSDAARTPRAWFAAATPATRTRLIGAAVATPALLVLGLSAWLTPNPQGYGTHLQLGLSGCTLLELTGWPCPMCGMTTTFALLAHLRPLDALRTQPFGLVLFGITVLAAVLGGLDLLAGRGALRAALRRMEPFEGRISVGLLVGLLVGWAYKAALLHPVVFGLAPP